MGLVVVLSLRSEFAGLEGCVSWEEGRGGREASVGVEGGGERGLAGVVGGRGGAE